MSYASGSSRTRPTLAISAGVASLLLHAGLAVVILRTPVPLSAPLQASGWSTEIAFGSDGWPAEQPKATQPESPTQAQDAEPPQQALDAAKQQAAIQQPQPPPPERFVRPGIDDAKNDSQAWLGATQATPHEAPRSEVDQSAQAMDPGLPGAPGLDGPEDAKSDEQVGGAMPQTLPSDAPRQPQLPQHPQSQSPPPQSQPQPALPLQAETPQPPPPPLSKAQPSSSTVQPLTPLTNPVSQPSAASEKVTAKVAPVGPSTSDEFATPVDVAVMDQAKDQTGTLLDAGLHQKNPKQPPAESQQVSSEPPEPMKPENQVQAAPVEPAPQPIPPIPPLPQQTPTAFPPAPTPPPPTPNAPAADVMGSPTATPATGKGGNIRMPGEKTDAESTASSREVSMTYRPGRPLAGPGIRVRPVSPRFSHTAKLTTSPRNPLILIKFNRKGIVTSVEFEKNQGTGYTDIDGPLRDSIFRWTASGKALLELPANDPTATVTMKLEYLLRE